MSAYYRGGRRPQPLPRTMYRATGFRARIPSCEGSARRSRGTSPRAREALCQMSYFGHNVSDFRHIGWGTVHRRYCGMCPISDIGCRISDTCVRYDTVANVRRLSNSVTNLKKVTLGVTKRPVGNKK